MTQYNLYKDGNWVDTWGTYQGHPVGDCPTEYSDEEYYAVEQAMLRGEASVQVGKHLFTWQPEETAPRQPMTCPDCGGTGYVDEDGGQDPLHGTLMCPNCMGTGWIGDGGE